MKLALGTAQFGLPYGVANQSGQVSALEAECILREARSAGVHVLDTATAYGEAETQLGKIGVDGWDIVSKLIACPDDVSDFVSWVRTQLSGSLQRLKLARLYGLILHRPQQLLDSCGPQLYSALVAIREEGLVAKIGVSIYDPAELDALLPGFRFDLVQAPLNLIDRRLVSTNWLRRLHEAGVEVHARSAFLQGLLLMSRERRPAKFDRWTSLWNQWALWLKQSGMTPLEACLAFVLGHPQVDRVVVGVDSAEQLRQVIGASQRSIAEFPDDLQSSDPLLINPTMWNQL
jgi:aryl-alcohol dehydrogenase-like predicted oxidoreductase